MLQKQPSNFRVHSIKHYHRLIIPILAILLCLTVLAVSLGDPAGLWAPASNTYAQASNSLFGVEANTLLPVDGLNYLTQTQTAWVRGPVVFWNDIELTEGTYTWANLGDVVTELQIAQNNGYEPIVVVTGTPDWAQAIPGSTCGPIKPSAYISFANFIAAMMNDQTSPLKDLNIKYWELWNEPDVSINDVPFPTFTWFGCWGDDADPVYYGGDKYGDMLNVVYPVIKAYNSQAQVLIGGLLLDCDPNNPPPSKDCSSANFLKGILSSNAGGSFDGISYHAYDYYGTALGEYANINWNTSWQDNGPSLVNKAAYILNVLQANHVKGKYLLNTETALICDTCSGDTDFELTKAYYLAEAYGNAIAQGLRANVWFSLRGEWGKNNGLLDLNNNLTPLPAYYAYQFAAKELNGASYVGKVTSFQGVDGFEFDLGTHHVWLMWVPEGGNITVDLGAIPSKIYTVDGTSITPTSEQLVLTREPFYVELPAKLPRMHLPITNYKSYASIPNGDFEEGQAGWLLFNNGLPANLISSHPADPTTGGVDANVPAGNYSVLLGDPNIDCSVPGVVPLGYAEVRRNIDIPVRPNEPIWLDFNYIIYSQDASTSNIYDRFEVYVEDTANPAFWDGSMVSSPLSCSNWRRVPGPENPRNGQTSGWALGSIDVSAYQGQSVTVYFRNYSRFDHYYNTYTFLDNIRLR